MMRSRKSSRHHGAIQIARACCKSRRRRRRAVQNAPWPDSITTVYFDDDWRNISIALIYPQRLSQLSYTSAPMKTLCLALLLLTSSLAWVQDQNHSSPVFSTVLETLYCEQSAALCRQSALSYLLTGPGISQASKEGEDHWHRCPYRSSGP